MPRITSPTDAILGALLAGLGAAGIYLSARLPMGSAVRMGPGYFPTLVSWILLGFGLLIFLRSFVLSGSAIGYVKARPLVLVLGAVGVFSLGIQTLGLLATILVMVPVAGIASAESRPLEVLVAAVVLGLFSCGLFIGLLGLPMTALPPWLPSVTELSRPTQVP